MEVLRGERAILCFGGIRFGFSGAVADLAQIEERMILSFLLLRADLGIGSQTAALDEVPRVREP